MYFGITKSMISYHSSALPVERVIEISQESDTLKKEHYSK